VSPLLLGFFETVEVEGKRVEEGREKKEERRKKEEGRKRKRKKKTLLKPVIG
jgi:hypothetical protein